MFTFSSKKKKHLMAGMFFILGLVLAAGAARMSERYTGLGKFLRYTGWPAPKTLGPDVYLAYNDFGLENYVHYHHLGPAVDYARQADVIITGNSRVQCGFSREETARFSRWSGLRIYNLGFGYADGMKFVLEVIRRQDLRPRIIVVNADQYFRDHLSSFSRRVINDRRWQAWKTVRDRQTAWRVRTAIHRVFPELRYFKNLNRWILYRSFVDGNWIVVLGLDRRFPVRPGARPQEIQQQLETARSFVTEMQSRGAEVVFTLVPYDQADYTWAAQTAADLNVPFIAPRLQGLYTSDGSHLTEDSALIFTRAFYLEFLKLDAVDRLIKEKRIQKIRE